MPSVLDTLPHVDAPTRRRWRTWLEKNHDRSRGVWLIFYKQSSGRPRLPYNDAVEEALCFGWVDSLVRKLDDDRYIQLFTPRKPRSTWSKPNKQRVERMIAAGLMTPAGFESIETAKRNGSWSVLDTVEALEIPPDLATAFRKHSGAARQFAGFSRSVKKAILAWIASAKQPGTRQARIDKTARMAARGLRAQIDAE